MLPVKKLSPSSITTLDMCEMKWFLQYMAGFREPTGKAAAIGTICHYILECVAQAKILRQQGLALKEDKIVGEIKANYDLNHFIEESYKHFTEKESHLKWEPADRRAVEKNIEIAKNHELYPDNHGEIITPEKYFSLPLDQAWAKYTYLNKEGQVETGQLNINGIIDLVYRDKQGVLNYLDYKFGQPKNWATGKNKEYSDIAKDVQLCMYYLALKTLFPDETICVNIWYVKSKIVYTDYFGQDQEDLILKKLAAVMNRLRAMEKPATKYGFYCKFCPFSKTSFKEWGKPHLDINHNKFGGRFQPVDGKVCVCDATKTFIDVRGLTTTIGKIA